MMPPPKSVAFSFISPVAPEITPPIQFRRIGFNEILGKGHKKVWFPRSLSPSLATHSAMMFFGPQIETFPWPVPFYGHKKELLLTGSQPRFEIIECLQ
ncbi:MAG: hypothetical protein LUQ33_07900 [Methanoregulaceae archaeon]|nr:hypothetical protein [Methanoregulaceae archaeon]